MAYPTVTYSFSNGTAADATQMNTNFNDVLNGISDGTKDINVNTATVNSTLNVTGATTLASTLAVNGNTTLGNATSDTVTCNAKYTQAGEQYRTLVRVTGAATYTVGTGDYYIIGDTAAGNVTVVLPAIPTAGRTILVKKNGSTNNCYVQGAGEDIDGSASDHTVTQNYGATEMTWNVSDGWLITSKK